jgi:hypothetical protein
MFVAMFGKTVNVHGLHVFLSGNAAALRLVGVLTSKLARDVTLH